ncbi:MAG: hypothetical protein R3251_00940 [Candidatus Spechtbacterales bacterium]|nr:hypothetical protein [Candidatus Spechtbacterales bacterium]
MELIEVVNTIFNAAIDAVKAWEPGTLDFIIVLAIPFAVAGIFILYYRIKEIGMTQEFAAPEPDCKNCNGTGIAEEYFPNFVALATETQTEWKRCACVHPHKRWNTHTKEEYVECVVQRISCRDERDKKTKATDNPA